MKVAPFLDLSPQIRALHLRYGLTDWHRSGAALHEAKALWSVAPTDPLVNPYGVFTNAAGVLLAQARPERFYARAWLAQAPNSLWAMSVGWRSHTCGQEGLPSVWSRRAYYTRAGAIQAAAASMRTDFQCLARDNPSVSADERRVARDICAQLALVVGQEQLTLW